MCYSSKVIIFEFLSYFVAISEIVGQFIYFLFCKSLNVQVITFSLNCNTN